jgi:hypothetical protein
MNPPSLTTTRRIKRIAPLQAGKILAILFGVMGLIAIPFVLIMTVMMSQLPPAQRGIFAFIGVGMSVMIPVFYAVMGFLQGVIGAAIYNLIVKWVGGFEVEVE